MSGVIEKHREFDIIKKHRGSVEWMQCEVITYVIEGTIKKYEKKNCRMYKYTG